MTTRTNKLSALAIAATALLATSSAFAGGISKGGTPAKFGKNPIVNTIHPIVQHGPLHGPGSSHNPIVRNCTGPDTLCRRP